MTETEKKLKRLEEHLQSLGSAAVAFSGGTDSAFLLAAAFRVLGEQAVAVTARSAAFPGRELEEALSFTKERGIRHLVFEFPEMQVEGFAENPPDRCYYCKREILRRMREIAGREGLARVIEGSNADDAGDYRPGARAVREQEVESPLLKAGLTKAEIREVSRAWGLPTWAKQSAACLASRFAYGEPITREKLNMAEKAEDWLRERGFGQLRVRVHGNLARIEVTEADFSRASELQFRRALAGAFRRMGFAYVTLDAEGYRMGSMNEVLEPWM